MAAEIITVRHHSDPPVPIQAPLVQNTDTRFPILSYLTFAEQSKCAAVCKDWQAVSNAARAGSHVGLNAGRLYELTSPGLDRGHLYFAERNALAGNPLTNPLLVAALNKARVVAFDGLPVPKDPDQVLEQVKKTFPLPQQILEPQELAKIHADCFSLLEKTLPSEELSALQTRIKEQDLDMRAQVGLAFGALYVKPLQARHHPAAGLHRDALRRGKEVRDLSEGDESDVHALSQLSKIVLPPTGGAVIGYLATEQGRESFFRSDSLQDQAWFHGRERSGQSSFGDDLERDVFPIPSLKEYEELSKKLKEELQTQDEQFAKARAALEQYASGQSGVAVGQSVAEVTAAPDKLRSLQQRQSEAFATWKRQSEARRVAVEAGTVMAHADVQRARVLAGKIETALLGETPLVITRENEDLLQSLKERGIGVVGPIRVPTKPCGMLWDVLSPNDTDPKGRVVASAVGSIHIAPERWLSFNQAFLDRLHRAKTLALEVDVYREDIGRAMWAQRKERREAIIGALSPQEQEQLRGNLDQILDHFHMDRSSLASLSKEEAIIAALEGLQSKMVKNARLTDGVDTRLCELAQEKGLPIQDLESLSLHLEAFRDESNPPFDQSTVSSLATGSLAGNLTRLERMQQAANKVLGEELDTWEDGRFDAQEASWKKASVFPAEQESMVRRNKAMAATIHRLAQSGSQPMAVAGAFHFIGSDSIPDILNRHYGYGMRRVVSHEPDVPKTLALCNKV